MEDEFQKMKKEFKIFLHKLACETNLFEGVTLVGSHKENKGMEKMNDIDVVLIMKELTEENWNKVIESFNEFKSKYETNKIGYIVETGFGPFKTPSGKDITVQLHVLFFDKKSFIEYAKGSPLISYDWEFSLPVWGKSLKEICKVEKITKKDLIEARGGADYIIEQIRNGVNIILRPGFDERGEFKKEIIKISQNTEQKAESYYKSFKHIFMHIFEVENENKKPTDIELEKIAKRILGEEKLKDLKNLENSYILARSGENISEERLEKSKETALDLMILVRKYIEDM